MSDVPIWTMTETLLDIIASSFTCPLKLDFGHLSFNVKDSYLWSGSLHSLFVVIYFDGSDINLYYFTHSGRDPLDRPPQGLGPYVRNPKVA